MSESPLPAASIGPFRRGSGRAQRQNLLPVIPSSLGLDDEVAVGNYQRALSSRISSTSFSEAVLMELFLCSSSSLRKIPLDF